MLEPLFFIDDWIDELPTERRLICLQRACTAIGVPYTLNPGGPMKLPELTSEGEEDLEAALGEEFRRMHARELLEELAADGSIVSDSVDLNGEIVYVKS